MRGAAVFRVRRAAVILLLAALTFTAGTGGSRAQHLMLTIGDIAGAGFSAKGIRAEYKNGAVAIHIAALKVGAQNWANIRLDCAALQFGHARIACANGMLALAGHIPLSFAYRTDRQVLEVALRPATGETWHVNLRPGKRGNNWSVRIDGGRLQRIAPWLPPQLPKINAGVVNGTLGYSGDGQMTAQLALSGVAFADVSGLHAGEKIDLMLEARARPAADRLRWDAQLSWNAGEAFWQPVYLKAARQQLIATGELDARQLRVDRGSLRYPGIGNVAFSVVYDLVAKAVTQAQGQARAIPVDALYELLLKPFLAGTSFADLRAGGRVSAAVQINAKGVQSADLHLDGVSFEDTAQRRFALFDINGTVPWRAAEPAQAAVTVRRGELLKMPVGAFAIPLGMEGTRFDLKHLRVPLLDGHIDVRDFVARAGGAGWYWQFSGAIGGISMDKLTVALAVPVMHGTLAASIPMVRHVKSSLRVDGALNLNVFDGVVQATNLVLLDIFGKAPRVQADVTMNNLDLELVTRTYSFGSMSGRIDARIAGLELVNWQPVKFDAQVVSSAGNYPRRISQAAVQNISALGGAGAVAAIQRSFLRFFEEFGYDKLGWRCKLTNSVCEMSGVEDREQGYVLVKGGGIPAITVIGYNRRVDWPELLERIRRVTQSNVKPIVK